MSEFLFLNGCEAGLVLVAVAVAGALFSYKKSSYGMALLVSLAAMMGFAFMSCDQRFSGFIFDLSAIIAVAFLIMAVVFFILWCFSLTKK